MCVVSPSAPRAPTSLLRSTRTARPCDSTRLPSGRAGAGGDHWTEAQHELLLRDHVSLSEDGEGRGRGEPAPCGTTLKTWKHVETTYPDVDGSRDVASERGGRGGSNG